MFSLWWETFSYGLAIWFSVGERAIARLSRSRRVVFSKAKIRLQNQFKPKRRGASTFQALSSDRKKLLYYLHRQITRISYRTSTVVVAAILYACVLGTSHLHVLAHVHKLSVFHMQNGCVNDYSSTLRWIILSVIF